MNRVVEWTRFGRRQAASSAAGGSGGGSVDDILKRLGAVEASLNEIRAQVSAISAVLPHLATRAELKADIHSLETSLIKWIVGTAIASVAVSSAVVSVVSKFVS